MRVYRGKMKVPNPGNLNHPFLIPLLQSTAILFLLFLLSVIPGIDSALPLNALTTIGISTAVISPSLGFFIARELELIREFFKIGGTLVARLVPAGIGLLFGFALDSKPLAGASELCILFAWIEWMWRLTKMMADYYKRELKA